MKGRELRLLGLARRGRESTPHLEGDEAASWDDHGSLLEAGGSGRCLCLLSGGAGGKGLWVAAAVAAAGVDDNLVIDCFKVGGLGVSLLVSV